MAQHQPKTYKRLAVAGAVLFSLTAGFAHADAFSSGVNTQEVTQMRQRMDALESQLSTLRQQQEQARVDAEAAQRPNSTIGPDGMPVPVRPGLPDVKRAADLDPLAEPPYLVMGTVNGHYLVKQGDKRHLLTPGELEIFEAKELTRAHARLASGQGAVDAPDKDQAGISKLPAPPPPIAAGSPAKTAQPAPAQAVKPGNRAAQRATTTAK